MLFASCHSGPQWGAVDAEIKVRSVENPKLTNVLPSVPEISHNIVLILAFPVHSPSFFPRSPNFLTALALANTVSLVG